MSDVPQPTGNTPQSPVPDPGAQEPVSDIGTAIGCFVIFAVVGVIVLVCVNFLIGVVMFFASQDPNPPGKEGNSAPVQTPNSQEMPQQ